MGHSRWSSCKPDQLHLILFLWYSSHGSTQPEEIKEHTWRPGKKSFYLMNQCISQNFATSFCFSEVRAQGDLFHCRCEQCEEMWDEAYLKLLPSQMNSHNYLPLVVASSTEAGFQLCIFALFLRSLANFHINWQRCLTHYFSRSVLSNHDTSEELSTSIPGEYYVFPLSSVEPKLEK